MYSLITTQAYSTASLAGIFIDGKSLTKGILGEIPIQQYFDTTLKPD